jgi:hypothetical protein
MLRYSAHVWQPFPPPSHSAGLFLTWDSSFERTTKELEIPSSQRIEAFKESSASVVPRQGSIKNKYTLLEYKNRGNLVFGQKHTNCGTFHMCWLIDWLRVDTVGTSFQLHWLTNRTRIYTTTATATDSNNIEFTVHTATAPSSFTLQKLHTNNQED